MEYPATFEKADTGYVVSFRDIPEAITQGCDYEDAVINGKDALITSLDFYFEDHRTVPAPSPPMDGEVMISLPISISAKVFLLNAMLEKRVSQVELGRRMNVRSQEITRIVKLSHPTKIDTMQNALRVLGKKLMISIK